MLELYHTDHSVYSQKVRVCLGEKKLDYVSREIDIVAGEHQNSAISITAWRTMWGAAEHGGLGR